MPKMRPLHVATRIWTLREEEIVGILKRPKDDDQAPELGAEGDFKFWDQWWEALGGGGKLTSHTRTSGSVTAVQGAGWVAWDE